MKVDLTINLDNLKAEVWQVSEVDGLRMAVQDLDIDCRPSNEWLIREGFLRC